MDLELLKSYHSHTPAQGWGSKRTIRTLANYPDPVVHIACPKCGRDGRLSKARLMAEHDRDIPLPDLRHILAACPRRGQMNDPCEVVFTDLVR